MPAANFAPGWSVIVTSLTRPVSFYGAISGFFRLSIDSVGKKNYNKLQGKTGAEAIYSQPEPKRRVNLPMVPPGGFSRGGQFERERVVPPLSRTTFLTFLPEQESKAPLASACRKPIGEQKKRLKMGIDNHKQVPSQNQTDSFLPTVRCLLVVSYMVWYISGFWVNNIQEHQI